MKFGLFVNSQQPRTQDPVLSFRQCVQQVIVARDAGFDAIAAGHHYVSPPYIAIQNLPFLARLSAESGNMDLVLAVTLLALLNPVQTAEEIALARCDVGRPGRVRRRHRLPRGGVPGVRAASRRPGAAHAGGAAPYQAVVERGQRHAPGPLLQPARGNLDDPPGAAPRTRRSGSPPTRTRRSSAPAGSVTRGSSTRTPRCRRPSGNGGCTKRRSPRTATNYRLSGR